MMTKSGRWILFFAMMMIATDLEVARACGRADVWIERYSQAKNDRIRESALEEISAFCSDYKATVTGPRIAKLLLDANSRGLRKSVIGGVLKRYRCFPDVTDEQISGQLKALAEELGVRCPTARSYVRVKVDYTIRLRKRPGRSSEDLGFMEHDALLDLLSRQGAWLKVRHWNDVVGFVRSSEVEVYPAR